MCNGKGTMACWAKVRGERGTFTAENKSRRARSQSKSNPGADMVHDLFLLIIDVLILIINYILVIIAARK